MFKYFISLFIITSSFTVAQNQINGIITNIEDGKPLSGADILILDQNTGTVTDEKGEFIINNLPNGKIKIQFSYLGFKTIIKTVFVKNNSQVIIVELEPTIIQTQEVVISGGSISSQHENAIKIETINSKEINLVGTVNFMEAIAEVPGIDIISKGPGVSKPVIRGLSMTNIIMLNNGVKIENYQFSENHPFLVDEFGIDKVEIIKGPASLVYGSDAVGGVINLIREKPAPVGVIMGDFSTAFHSNTLGTATNFGIKGNSKMYFWGIRAGLKSHKDYRDGENNFVPNTRFNSHSVKLQSGIIKPFGTFKLFYDYNADKLGMSVGPSIILVTTNKRMNEVWYQDLNNHLLTLQNKLFLGNYKLELNAAFQTNNRKLQTSELTPTFTMVDMDLHVFSYEAKIYFPSKAYSEYILGLQGMNQKNKNNGAPEHVLPDAKVNDISAFGLIQYTFFENIKVQSGIRYDIRSISTLQEKGKEEINKNYSNLSLSAGSTYKVNEKFLLRGNFASAYRTPNIAELTQNGMHGAHYEQGNPNLNDQKSYESDLSMHFHSEYATFDLSGFYNSISNYIYISPTNDTVETGDKIYRYSQTKANIYGYEAGLNICPFNYANVSLTYSSLIGEQSNGEYLPFIPQNKLKAAIKISKEKPGRLKFIYGKISFLYAFPQNKPSLFETTTASYNLINLGFGGEVGWHKQNISIDFTINNLFNQKYIDHLSTLKGIGLYNMGRNISGSVKIPFEINK